MVEKITIVVLVFVIVILGYFTKSDEKEYETLIEQLQIKNDSLKFNNELLDTQIALQRAIADSLSKEVQITNGVINKLKRARYERIRTIDSMDSNELLEFFSNFGAEYPDN